MIDLLPSWPTHPLLLLLLSVDVDSEISSTGLDIHILNADEARSVPDLVADVEDEDDGDGHDLEEEVLDNGG